jgi:uncharacterized protein YjbI with pentapeptide repeats
MDGTRFDRLARSVGARRSRRQMVVGLLAGLGTALATLPGERPLGAGASAATPRRRRRVTSQAAARRAPLARLRDCPNPGPGQNLSRCNFVDQDLRGANLSGANLSGAVFAHANLCAANLRGANLAKTDFTWAVLTRADLRGTTLATAILDHAAFCRTQLPNGTLDNSHCPRDDDDICCSDADCGAGVACQRGWCGGRPPQAGACKALGDVCTIGARPGCCGYAGPKNPVCDGTLGIVLTTCQLTCAGDADCKSNLGTSDAFCAFGANCFPFEKCCFRKLTGDPKQCSSGTSCPVGQRSHQCCLSGDTACSVVGFGCV